MRLESGDVDVLTAADAMSALQLDSDEYMFEGHVDFYGYHRQADGWIFGGWIAHPWPLRHRPQNAVAQFADASVAEHPKTLFYHRADVSGRGIGYIFFFHSAPAPEADFMSLRLESAGVTHVMHPTPDVLVLSDGQLVDHLQGMLPGGEEGSHRGKIRELLGGKILSEVATGFVDLYGYHSVAGGWMFCGWISLGWPEGQSPEQIVISFEDGDIGGEVFAVLYPRHDLKGSAEGIVGFARGAATPLGSLCSISFKAGPLRATLQAAPTTTRVRETELVARLRPLLGQAPSSLHRDIVLGLLGRRPYSGEDTLSSLTTTVFVEIDEAIRCGPDGLVLMGWYLAKPGDISRMSVRSGPLISPLDLAGGIRVDRPDVVESFSAQGFTDPRCGFIVFLPRAVAPDSATYIEVETSRREVGYRAIPRFKLDGVAAMKRLLASVDVRFTEVRRAFDQVLGPAVEALNRSRLAKRPAVTVIDYGEVPQTPRFSVIVPLYGRLDFVEYQLALFSAHSSCADVEFLYVLDDPPKRREAQFLFASVYERFLVPFRTVLLEHNVGFAPANNIGLRHARGEFVVYLNSDVFPGTLDWMDRLADRLTADPKLGVVGPLLLFEDGSVQHRGMFFQRLPEFGDWFFGMHGGKGLRHPGGEDLERSLSITGACMMLRRSLAEQIGGFDEIYAIGDFEDSDLCLKLQALGYDCAVDPTIHLFHLERKSQAGSGLGWRMNLTVYNAWQHERRWGATIAARQAVTIEAPAIRALAGLDA